MERLHWIFNYTSKNVFYILAKTFCIVVGAPIYAIMFIVEMVLTAVNMMFSWIPIFNVFIMVICKSLIYIVDKTFYICILTDIRKYNAAMRTEPGYNIVDDHGEQHDNLPITDSTSFTDVEKSMDGKSCVESDESPDEGKSNKEDTEV